MSSTEVQDQNPVQVSTRQPWLGFFTEYFWWILKNVIGWVLILTAWPIGLLFPAPLGFPLFLIGFALITFPGKRRLTARVLRGKAFLLKERPVFLTRVILSLLACSAAVWFLQWKHEDFLRKFPHSTTMVFGAAFLMLALTWVISGLAVPVVNWGLRMSPRLRKRVRPWMNRHGVNLLPPRRRKRLHRKPGDAVFREDEGILEIADAQQERMQRLGSIAWYWIRRLLMPGLVVAIFVWMIRPIVQKWSDLQPYVHTLRPGTFIVASLMFTLFLFFRAMTWRRILAAFGFVLPAGAATRVWISSEIARYVPGSILQFAGRVMLLGPYGVPRAICITSQVLELSAFLLANIVIAISCLLWYFSKIQDPHSRIFFYIFIGLLPLLGFFLHPRIFSRVVNGLRSRFGKKPIEVRLPGRVLAVLFVACLIALGWQSIAIWMLTHTGLDLKLAWWWRVAGAYCLAWCAGFIVPLAPGGMGIRETVFVVALQEVLPPQIKSHFPDSATFHAYVNFLGILLRLWTIVGELMLLALGIISDPRGFMGRKGAPGRKDSSDPH